MPVGMLSPEDVTEDLVTCQMVSMFHHSLLLALTVVATLGEGQLEAVAVGLELHLADQCER